MLQKLLIFVLFASSLFAQQEHLDSLVTTGIHQIYSIQFDEADSTFASVRKDFPNHPAGNFFDAMIVWWRILLDLRSETYDDMLRDKLEIVIDQCDDILDEDETNVDAMFFKGGALGYRGRLSALRYDWFDAASDGKDALPLVFWAYELDSTNTDVILGFGIYNYFAEIIPEVFPPVEPLMIFFPDGDKKKGIEQLEFVGENGKYAKFEALYFLMTSYYSFEKNNIKALSYAKILNEEFPNNPRFESYRGRINIRMNSYNKASKIFSSIIDKYNLGYTGYTERVKREAEYYLGTYYNRKDSLALAETHFLNCESLSRVVDKDEESGFLVNTLLYLGKISDIKGMREKAVAYYEEVLDLDEFSSSHEKAEKYLKKPHKK
ncbi:MAG: tetratricopeptide repeat protein [Melioribacteraceae bacterium]|jgi:tetratricopeptide (TPR) repeat protein|nr:tetratricopeptide repeat protein [Melioribacteraceae bacterium]